jgi:hypothetical protein
MGDAESIRNLFEQIGRVGKGSLTIDDLCLSVIAPPLMEKIRDDLIGDKMQINKQTSDEWRLVPVSNPNSVSAHSILLIRRTRSRTVSNHMQLESTLGTFSTARGLLPCALGRPPALAARPHKATTEAP